MSQLQKPETSLPIQYFPQESLFPQPLGFLSKASGGPDHQFSLEVTHHLKNKRQSKINLLSTYWTVYLSVEPLLLLFVP